MDLGKVKSMAAKIKQRHIGYHFFLLETVTDKLEFTDNSQVSQ